MIEEARREAGRAVRMTDVAVHGLLVVAAVIAAVILAPGPSAREGAGGPARTDRATLVAAIGRLTVAPPAAATPYDRAAFPHWIEIGSDCDTRCAVLDRQRDAGGWLSAYDGYVARGARELEIDHVVPLAEAWVSGASAWSIGRRRAFANDLASAELLAVSAWSNRAKGASDPAAWRPPDRGWWCAYADAWVAVKLRWALTADPAEVDALHDLARTC